MGLFVLELLVRGVVLWALVALALVLLRRVAAAYRHLVCVLALVSFLILPLAQRVLPPLGLLPARMVAIPAGGVLKERPPKTVGPSKATTLLPPDAVTPANTMAPAKVGSQPKHFWSATTILFTVWGIGAAALLLRLGVALLRLRRLEAGSREAMVSGVPVRVSEQVQTPLTWGVGRSIILLPSTLLSGDPAVRESALRHEQAHVARWDWAWNLLAEMVCALCWFQPGIWWLRSRMRLESERACDDRVLLSGIAGPDYAEHLLAIVRLVGTIEVAPGMADGGGMEERMRHILDTKKSRSVRFAGMAGTVPFALVLLSLAALRVSARPGEVTRQTEGRNVTNTKGAIGKHSVTGNAVTHIGAGVMKHATSSSQPAKFVEPTATPISTEQAEEPPAQDDSTGQGSPSIQFANVIWGEAVEGLEPGFLLTMSGSRNNVRVPFNAQVDYTVLVRNTTDREILFEVRRGDADTFNTAPYLIPSDNLTDSLRSRPLPERFHARRLVDELSLIAPAYYVKLAPGEAVMVPGERGLYIGDADKQRDPRIETITAGMNWIVQPITVRILSTEEQAQFEKMSKTPYSSKKEMTLVARDGKARQVFMPLVGAQSGGKQLCAKIQLEVGTRNAEASRNADAALWGKVERGMQCGIRLLNPKATYQLGDTLQAELLLRNTSDASIRSVLPRKFDLYSSIYDTTGRLQQIDFGARVNLYPGSHTFEPGEVRSLGLIEITLVAKGTPSPISNAEPGHITLAPGTYKLSGSGGVGDPNPESGAIAFQVVGENAEAPNAEGIAWGEKVRGFQLGTRLASENSVFKVGDTIKFEAFGRNLSGNDVKLSIGNYWKVNYKIQVETVDGKPIYWDRDARNKPDQVAGYRLESFENGSTQEISSAALKIGQAQRKTEPTRYGEDAWVETVVLKPGRYRVRLLSWGVFGEDKPEPTSGWVPIEVRGE